MGERGWRMVENPVPRVVLSIMGGMPADVAAALIQATSAVVEGAYVTASPEGGVDLKVPEWPPVIRGNRPIRTVAVVPPVAPPMERHLPCGYRPDCAFRSASEQGMLVHLANGHGLRGQAPEVIEGRRASMYRTFTQAGLRLTAEKYAPPDPRPLTEVLADWEDGDPVGVVPDQDPGGNVPRGEPPLDPPPSDELDGVNTTASQEPPQPDPIRCPDDGACHHECGAGGQCWRVHNAGPLSDVYPQDRWPVEILVAQGVEWRYPSEPTEPVESDTPDVQARWAQRRAEALELCEGMNRHQRRSLANTLGINPITLERWIREEEVMVR